MQQQTTTVFLLVSPKHIVVSYFELGKCYDPKEAEESKQKRFWFIFIPPKPLKIIRRDPLLKSIMETADQCVKFVQVNNRHQSGLMDVVLVFLLLN